MALENLTRNGGKTTDVLSPHGFDDIVKDDFAKLREMLSRCR